MAWHPEKVNQVVVSESCEAIAKEFAKGTDTVFDDLAAAQTGKAIAYLLNKVLGPQAMSGVDDCCEAVFDAPVKVSTLDAKRELIQAIADRKWGKRVELNPTMIALLLQLALPVIKNLLDQLSKK